MSRAEELRKEKEQSGEMFNRIYRKYDLLNHLLTFGLDLRWRRIAAIKLSNAGIPGEEAAFLDLAAGTGDMTIALKKRFPSATLTAADISDGMLSRAGMKFRKKGYNDIQIILEDAGNLSMKEGTYDAITVAFGVRNFPFLEQSLKECFRVLRPGGKLVILEFGWPGNRLMSLLYRLFSATVIPFMGKVIAGDSSAYLYLKKTIRTFPYGKQFLKILEEAGFRIVSFRTFSGGIVYLYAGEKGS